MAHFDIGDFFLHFIIGYIIILLFKYFVDVFVRLSFLLFWWYSNDLSSPQSGTHAAKPAHTPHLLFTFRLYRILTLIYGSPVLISILDIRTWTQSIHPCPNHLIHHYTFPELAISSGGDGSNQQKYFRAMIFFNNKPGLTDEFFHEHWKSVHADLTIQVADAGVDLVRYSQVSLTMLV